MTPNTKIALSASTLVAAMLGLAFASKPLYDTFCRVTGFGGTTRIATEMPDAVLDRAVEVRFDANVSGAPVRFRPQQVSQAVHLGEHKLAFYEVTNDGTEPVSMIASFNVTPHKAGAYFNKLSCFCFEERVIGPGETRSLPVVYFVSPDLDDKRILDDVHTITLSYTFFDTNAWKGATNGAAGD